jgi:hypothetical protein
MRDSGRWMSLAHGWLLGCWRSRQAAKELISIRDPKKNTLFLPWPGGEIVFTWPWKDAKRHTTNVVTPVDQKPLVDRLYMGCVGFDSPVLLAHDGGRTPTFSLDVLGTP